MSGEVPEQAAGVVHADVQIHYLVVRGGVQGEGLR